MQFDHKGLAHLAVDQQVSEVPPPVDWQWPLTPQWPQYLRGSPGSTPWPLLQGITPWESLFLHIFEWHLELDKGELHCWQWRHQDFKKGEGQDLQLGGGGGQIGDKQKNKSNFPRWQAKKSHSNYFFFWGGGGGRLMPPTPLPPPPGATTNSCIAFSSVLIYYVNQLIYCSDKA